MTYQRQLSPALAVRGMGLSVSKEDSSQGGLPPQRLAVPDLRRESHGGDIHRGVLRQQGLQVGGESVLRVDAMQLILADGSTMNVGTSEEPINNVCIYCNDCSLTIYGQTLGSGALSIYTTDDGDDGIYARNVTINGGNITAYTNGESAFALRVLNNITINGGTIRVNSTGPAAHAIHTNREFNYNGGNVNATGSCGIYSMGTITLGWTRDTDRIYASRYNGTITFKRLFKNANGSKLYGGTLTGSALDALNEALSGVTLYPYVATLTLAARQAPDENYWTTFYCGHTDYQIPDQENACAYTATYDPDAAQLTLHNQGRDIPKATAVIIVADNNEVTLTAATLDAFTGTNDLHGHDQDTPLTSLGDGTFYVLGNTNNHFGFHRYQDTNMPARKAYVLVPSSGEALARSLDMVFGNASGIDAQLMVNRQSSMVNVQWFTLDGMKLSGKPTAKGLYIYKGKKVAIK